MEMTKNTSAVFSCVSKKQWMSKQQFSSNGLLTSVKIAT